MRLRHVWFSSLLKEVKFRGTEMVCKNCGRITSDDESCCRSCGFAVQPEAEGLPVSEPQKKRRAVLRLLSVFFIAAILVAGYFGVRYYLHLVEVNSAAEEFQRAVSRAEELSTDVEAMYTEKDGGEIRGDLTPKEINEARGRLEGIMAEPNSDYADEVAERLDTKAHQRLMEKLDARLLEAAEKRDIMDMQVFLDQGLELSQRVEELFAQPGGDFIRPRLVDTEIRPLTKELSEIPRDPEGEYAEAVKKNLNISAHHKLLDSIEARLLEAEEKRLAKAEVNNLFEVTAITDEGYPENLPLKPESDEAAVTALAEKYGDKDIFDSFWFTVNKVLDNAKFELLWIKDARLAVQKLEDMKILPTEDQYSRAMDDVNFLQDGTIKNELMERLEAVNKRIEAGAEADEETDSAEVQIQEYLEGNPDFIDTSKMDEIFDGMASVKLDTEGSTLRIQVCYMSEWDGMLELIVDGLDDDLAEIDQAYIQRSAEMRKSIPSSELVLEVQKSTGEVMWSRSY